MAIAPDTIDGEKKTERLGMALTPTELAALQFVRELHGDRYDGDSSVLRDYSLTDAVAVYRRAREQFGK
jgi:hypothetical protein